MNIKQLEDSLNYKFSNECLIITALTHCSAGNINNERLEFLGDALIGSIIAEALYRKFPEATEGELTRLRATIVKGEALAKQARKLELGKFIQLGTGEMKSGGWRRNSILANTFEAIVGAIFLDSDFDTCKRTILAIFNPALNEVSPRKLEKDPKTRLQEYLQAHKHELPDYKILTEEGDAHAKKFFVACIINDLNVDTQAEGRSKRAAEQAAAQQALDILNIQM